MTESFRTALSGFRTPGLAAAMVPDATYPPDDGPVDLTIDIGGIDPFISPGPFLPHSILAIGAALWNLGNPTQNDVTIVTYFSTDPEVDDTDPVFSIQIREAPFSGAFFYGSVGGTIPGGVAQGTYYFRSLIDAGGVEPESDESNNWSNTIALNLRDASLEDFNGDTYSDILFWRSTDNALGYYEMSWRRPDQRPFVDLGQGGDGWAPVVQRDFSGDSIADILWFHAATQGVGYYAMDGATATWVDLGFAGPGWTPVGGGDFNHDGRDDILFLNPATEGIGYWASSGGGAMTWTPIGRYGPGYAVAGTGDFSGDGVHDILWFNETTRQVGFYEMDGGLVAWRDLGIAGQGFAVEGVGDFNDDGTDDILWLNAQSRAFGFYEMDAGTATWKSLGFAGPGWTVESIGDFDGQGHDDVVWRHADGRLGYHEISFYATEWVGLGTVGADWAVL